MTAVIQAATVQSDVRKIRECRTVAELDRYEAEGRLRGLDQWEVTALLEMRRKLEGRR